MIKQIKENVWQFHFKEFGSCVYLIKKSGTNILIDVSSKTARYELIEDLRELGIKPETIDIVILTHLHYDHMENLDLFPQAKKYSSKNTKELEKNFPEFKVIKTPGHTPGDICILYKDILFSGDTIFDKEHHYIGRTDLPESNPNQIQKSLEKLKKINYKILCAGHLI